MEERRWRTRGGGGEEVEDKRMEEERRWRRGYERGVEVTVEDDGR